MQFTSLIEISASALASNLDFLRTQIGPEARFASVVKGNAYGHGIDHFVPLAERLGVDLFAVFSAPEALRVLQARQRPETEIMIMGFIADEQLEWAIEHGVSFWVFDRERLEAAVVAAGLVGKPARVHLELETGMNRTGMSASQLNTALQLIVANRDRVRVDGVCTHFAGAESVTNDYRVRQQIQRFERVCDDLHRRGFALGLRHAACSAAALCYPESILDMVRCGIAQYGFWPSRECFMYHVARHGRRGQNPLKRLITWKSRVMSLKRVKAGEFVGYGTSYMPEKDIRVAVVPVGYSSGFGRSLSNQGRVLIHGKRASVIGVVNMSLILVNVSNIPGVARGDEVVLIGQQGSHTITVASFSELTKMVDYELLTRLPPDIPRVVVA